MLWINYLIKKKKEEEEGPPWASERIYVPPVFSSPLRLGLCSKFSINNTYPFKRNETFVVCESKESIPFASPGGRAVQRLPNK